MFVIGLVVIIAISPQAAAEHENKTVTHVAPQPNKNAVVSSTIDLSNFDFPAGPVNYFQNACARCHMSYGDAYLGIPKPLHGDALREKIVYMTNGPAQAPIDDDGITRQFELHNAIVERGPYIWFAPRTPGYLMGETLNDTTITITHNGQTITAQQYDHHWLIPGTFPPGTPLTATRNGKTIELKTP